MRPLRSAFFAEATAKALREADASDRRKADEEAAREKKEEKTQKELDMYEDTLQFLEDEGQQRFFHKRISELKAQIGVA